MKALFRIMVGIVFLLLIAANTFYLYKMHRFLNSRGALREEQQFKQKVLDYLEKIENKLKK